VQDDQAHSYGDEESKYESIESIPGLVDENVMRDITKLGGSEPLSQLEFEQFIMTDCPEVQKYVMRDLATVGPNEPLSELEFATFMNDLQER
jgi:hypothetical protein